MSYLSIALTLVGTAVVLSRFNLTKLYHLPSKTPNITKCPGKRSKTALMTLDLKYGKIKMTRGCSCFWFFLVFSDLGHLRALSHLTIITVDLWASSLYGLLQKRLAELCKLENTADKMLCFVQNVKTSVRVTPTRVPAPQL